MAEARTVGTAMLLAVAAISVAPAAAQESLRLAVTPDVCDRLVVHRPDDDVAYQSGVDVEGRPVAPADLPGTVRLTMPDTITIPVTVDIVERFGLPFDPGAIEADGLIGTLTLRGDRLTFNGQPLYDVEQDYLNWLCRQR